MEPRPAPEPGSPLAVRLLGAAIAVQLLAGLTGAVVLSRDAPAAGGVDTRARSAPAEPPAPLPPGPEQLREQAVRSLLAARAEAVLARDREAFLAGVDPAATEFRERQGRLFDALADVPLSGWSYDLDPDTAQPGDASLDARHGAGRWWSPGIALRYSLTGIDTVPAYQRHVLTFVERDGRWLLASDDDFAARGERTARGLWDTGPVVAVRGRASLVLGRPDDRPLLNRLARAVDAAVPRVTRVWGDGWPQAVAVLVPGSQAELGELLGKPGELSQIAAVATAELIETSGRTTAVGDRIILNPPNFADLGPVGRQVVLTHEVTHVATRQATGPDLPAWFVEGLADYIGYLDTDVPVTVAARELRADVRAGRLPATLPPDDAFRGDNPDLAQAYEQSWLAVRLLVEEYGEAEVLRLYRYLGASDAGPGAREAALDTALAELGTDTERFTAAWRSSLQRRLG